MTCTVSVLSVWVFSHAREAVYGLSKFTFCENLRLKTLRSRLEVFKKGVICVFPSRPGGLPAFRESATWGLDVELKAMESKQTGITLSLPLSPEHVHASSQVEFARDYLYPSPEACDTISFGLEDVLYTAASDSEDLGLL